MIHGPVSLRAPSKRDYRQWAEVALRNVEGLRAWQPRWPRDYLTERAYRRRLRLYATERSLGTGFAFHAFVEDRLVGVCRLASVRQGAARSGSLGYWTDAPERGKGYATAMVGALTAFAFESLALERVEAAYLPDNLASGRVLEKAGFRKEGVVRGFLEVNGARRDHQLVSLLRSDLSAAAPQRSRAEAETV
nr:GNAT family protein [Parvularcula dongshanensis]